MEEIKLLNNAFKIYNLNETPELEKNILNYISTRLVANRENFEKIIDILKSNITFDDIIKAFDLANREEEYYKKSSGLKQGKDYYSGEYLVPIGNIVVETNNVLDVIKYFVKGIKSRNTITISQTEYSEISLSNMILIIFVEALAKFNISRNTLMILPYEECFQEEFDEVIEIENDKTYIKQKEFSKQYIIYNQDNSFNREIEQEKQKLKERGIDFQIFTDSLEVALEKINTLRPVAVSIFTKDRKIAYEFINLVKAQNVFVNTSLLNSEELSKKINELYYKKKIMYPLAKEFNFEEYYKQYTDKEELNNISKNTTKTDISKKEENQPTALVEFVNPWYQKILEKIKNLFYRK